jgi:hypothetical protein
VEVTAYFLTGQILSSSETARNRKKVSQKQLATHRQQITGRKETKDLGEKLDEIPEYTNRCTILKSKSFL